MTESYLTLLEESLQKKIQVLDKIQSYNLRQQEIFQSDDVDMSRFDEYVEEKGQLIDEVNALDSGFETLYARVSEQLQGGREQYAEQIKRLQGLVSQVTEKSVAVQAQEARNKQLVEQYFSRQRRGIKESRTASKAAYDYYKSMSNAGHVPPQFMDSKQ